MCGMSWASYCTVTGASSDGIVPLVRTAGPALIWAGPVSSLAGFTGWPHAKPAADRRQASAAPTRGRMSFRYKTVSSRLVVLQPAADEHARPDLRRHRGGHDVVGIGRARSDER